MYYIFAKWIISIIDIKSSSVFRGIINTTIIIKNHLAREPSTNNIFFISLLFTVFICLLMVLMEFIFSFP